MFACLSVGGGEGGGGGENYVRIPRHNKSQPIFKMTLCIISGIDFNRVDNLQRHMKYKHKSLHTNNTMMQLPPRSLTFQHPFSMMVARPNGSGNTEWTRKLLFSSLV